MKNKFESYQGNGKETKEITETDFENLSRKIRDKGYRFHRQVHDKEGRDPKIYHTSEHLQTLESWAKQIADILHLPPQQEAIVKRVSLRGHYFSNLT